MAIDKNKLYKSIILIVVGLIIVYMVELNNMRHHLDLINALNDNGKCSIGEVIEYVSIHYGPGTNNSADLLYSFVVNGILYKNSTGYKIPDNNGPSKKSNFLVIYLPSNPESSLILLKYPIKDSIDFKRYLEEFKTNQLKLENY
jgi:hypothetical protein